MDFFSQFVDLEKTFDWVSRGAAWWVLKKLGTEEWLVCFAQCIG